MHHFNYDLRGDLCCEGLKLRRLAARYGTPLYVYSHAALVKHYKVFDRAFSGLEHQICYSVKANSSLAVLAVLAAQGSGADIVSGGELFRALYAGVLPGRIVYSGVGKTDQEISYALNAGIKMFSVESGQELLRIDKIAGRVKRRAPIAIRVNPDIDPKTHPHLATGLKSEKFGVDIDEAPAFYRRAARLRNVDIVGLSCHIGSQILELDPFTQALRKLRALIERLEADGHRIGLLDVGGGLGIDYGNGPGPHPRSYAAALRAELNGLDVCLVLEPGRMIAGNAGALITRVLYHKDQHGKRFTIVDAGMNDLIRPALYNSRHEIRPVLRTRKRKVVQDVVGPICESADFLARGRELPPVDPGGLLCVLSAGAYGFSMASNYNSRPRPAEVMVKGRRAHLIREREEYDDLIDNEHFRAFVK
ncbi:MAG: diaminopimelate decarboxylase [Candidatus Alcyoniella australis]|nr:diaminopimelate decarboxylase [Candidatus Alcyoniella australis]